jgi:selenocysteine lyase/cysteine desulfurase
VRSNRPFQPDVRRHDKARVRPQATLSGEAINGPLRDDLFHLSLLFRCTPAPVAGLLNADADEIAVTTSASAGINSLASALDFSDPRNEVLVSNLEFPTGAQIWYAQTSRDAVVEHAPEAADGTVPLEHFDRLIDERTKLVQITHVCYRNGAKIDVPGVVRLAHERGALVLLDCFQSVGAVDIDVSALGVDFAVGGMLKYLLGTAGIGFLYVDRRHIAALTPTVSGWFAQADIAAMDIFANTPSPTARRFEAGTPPVPNCYAAEAGIGLIREIGVPAIEARQHLWLAGRRHGRALHQGGRPRAARQGRHVQAGRNGWRTNYSRT